MDNDFTSLFFVAQSLMTLQALYGTIPYVYGKGDCAKVTNNFILQICHFTKMSSMFYDILCLYFCTLLRVVWSYVYSSLAHNAEKWYVNT